MGLCYEHAWFNDSTSTDAGCPEPVHHFPLPVVKGGAVIEVLPHDEERCDLCRALNEAKRQHYAMLSHDITVRP